MTRMRLHRSFGCLSLLAGTKIIGAVSLGSSLLSAMGLSVKMMEICQTFSSGEFYLIESQDLQILLAGLLVSCLVTGFTAGLMIYGARANNPDCVFPWLALVTADLMIAASMSFGFILVGPTMLTRDRFFIGLTTVSVYLAMHFYVWFVVYSFYKHQIDPLPCYEIDNVDGTLKIDLSKSATTTKSAHCQQSPQRHWA